MVMTENDKSPKWVVDCVRWFSPLSLSLSFIGMFVFRFGNDNYRYRYRLSTFSAVIVPKLFEFRYPTLSPTKGQPYPRKKLVAPVISHSKYFVVGWD